MTKTGKFFFIQHFGSWLQVNLKSFTAINLLPFSFERKGFKTMIQLIHKKFKKSDNFHFIELDNYREKFGLEPLIALFDQVNLDIYSLIK